MSAAELEEELSDGKRYVKMALHYRRLRRDYPSLNHALAARNAGAVAFDVTVEQLVSASRRKPLTLIRMKVLAATLLLTKLPPSHVSRAFRRSRTNVIYARRRYGKDIRAALGNMVNGRA